MIIVKLLGGLGNQMFQYAAARSLLKNEEYLYTDHYFFDTIKTNTEYSTVRKYQLDIFKNIKIRKANRMHLSFLFSKSYYYKILRYFSGSSIKHIHHPDSTYLPLSRVIKNEHIYLDGYFQSENYFKNYRHVILKDFQFPPLDPVNEDLKKMILASDNAVSVHIRRGDYVRSKTFFNIHGILPNSYYNKALKILQSKLPTMTLYIFSDDIDWVKGNLKLNNSEMYFIENNNDSDDWKDMALMSYCKHHIIANSSFSWWGAWLSVKSENVLAPYKWLNPLKVNFNIQDFIPDSWIIVTYD